MTNRGTSRNGNTHVVETKWLTRGFDMAVDPMSHLVDLPTQNGDVS